MLAGLPLRSPDPSDRQGNEEFSGEVFANGRSQRTLCVQRQGGNRQTSGPRLSNVAPTLDLQEANRSGFEARTKARAELVDANAKARAQAAMIAKAKK